MARQRSAKPRTAVRIRSRPQKTPSWVFFFVFQPFIEVANPLLTSNKGKKKTPAFAGVFFVQFQASLLLALHLFL